jgi:metal-responsive CopG/Arc/MetJ family transcriptional regulator
MRIGISLPENLLNMFDEIILQRGYSSRSEGVRDIIRSEVVVLRGDGEEVRKKAERMMALKGVKHVKLTTTSLGKEF